MEEGESLIDELESENRALRDLLKINDSFAFKSMQEITDELTKVEQVECSHAVEKLHGENTVNTLISEASRMIKQKAIDKKAAEKESDNAGGFGTAIPGSKNVPSKTI